MYVFHSQFALGLHIVVIYADTACTGVKNTCVYTRMHVYVNIFACTHVCMYMYMYMYMHEYTYTRVYTQMHVHIHIHLYVIYTKTIRIHVYINTHIHVCNSQPVHSQPRHLKTCVHVTYTRANTCV